MSAAATVRQLWEAWIEADRARELHSGTPLSTAFDTREQERWDRLVDFVEESDFTGTYLDPREAPDPRTALPHVE